MVQNSFGGRAMFASTNPAALLGMFTAYAVTSYSMGRRAKMSARPYSIFNLCWITFPILIGWVFQSLLDCFPHLCWIDFSIQWQPSLRLRHG
jgi:hypothetical protein